MPESQTQWSHWIGHAITLSSCVLFAFPANQALSQDAELPLKIFGYFQGNFTYINEKTGGSLEFLNQDRLDVEITSFSAQQLNLFLQRDINRKWAALVDFELLNSYSSFRRWGAFNLEEAWIRYRSSRQFNLKLGLQVPTFNNLNEIKNRTPLLPYVIRPLAYESSFSEFLAVEDYIPTRAYVQVYGIIPVSTLKFEYAAYVGNTPNIRNQSVPGQQSGVDTTAAFLFGGRIGMLAGELKAGLSATREEVNDLGGADLLIEGPDYNLNGVPRYRVGGDLSYQLGRLSFEGEFINVIHREKIEDLNVDKAFYYATLGYNLTEDLFAYSSVYFTRENYTLVKEIKLDIKGPTIGASYVLNDSITLKGQYLYGIVRQNGPDEIKFEQNLHYFTTAVSVVF